MSELSGSNYRSDSKKAKSSSSGVRRSRKKSGPQVITNLSEFKIGRFVPANHGTLLIEKGTPVDLAFGMNFLGETAYRSLGLTPAGIPEIPACITTDLLNSECPFFKGRRLVDTHILALIPETLNGSELTINSALKLLKPKYSYGYGNKDIFCKDQKFANMTAKSYWALIPMQVCHHDNMPGYQQTNARELFIAASVYSRFANREVFYGRHAVTTDIYNEDNKSRAVTVTAFSGEFKGVLNINTVDQDEIGNSRFFRGGYAFKRILE